MRSPTGIPAPERFVGGLLIRRWCRKNPPPRTIEIVREQQRALERLIQDAGPRAVQRVRIRRLPGLEKSSTNYSLAMVADHLARVNRDIAATLTQLARNRPGPIKVEIANYKPDAAAEPKKALADLEAATVALESALAEISAIERSTQRHAHPWFGPLSAVTWACFPSFHGAIHLKQARLIAGGL